MSLFFLGSDFLAFAPQDVLKREIGKIDGLFKDGFSCRLPLDPAVHVNGVNVDVRIYIAREHDLHHIALKCGRNMHSLVLSLPGL